VQIFTNAGEERRVHSFSISMRLHFCMVLLCDSQNIFSLAMLARRIAV